MFLNKNFGTRGAYWMRTFNILRPAALLNLSISQWLKTRLVVVVSKLISVLVICTKRISLFLWPKALLSLSISQGQFKEESSLFLVWYLPISHMQESWATLAEKWELHSFLSPVTKKTNFLIKEIFIVTSHKNKCRYKGNNTWTHQLW